MMKPNTERTALLGSRSGFTLTEAAIASGLLAMVIAGLFAAGLTSWRMVIHNRVTSEARFLAVQKLEEAAAENYADLVNGTATSLATQTNMIQNKYRAVRAIQIIGHAADRSVTNTADATYLEIHSFVIYSPLPDQLMTNVFSTIVSKNHP